MNARTANRSAARIIKEGAPAPGLSEFGPTLCSSIEKQTTAERDRFVDGPGAGAPSFAGKCESPSADPKQFVGGARYLFCLGLLSFLVGSMSSLAHGADDDRPADPRHQEVEKLIRHYFATWSKQDMEGYGACFADGASIQLLDSQGKVTTFALAPFLANQRQAHCTARHRQTETPESIDIRFEARLARVVVYWKLTSGPRTEYGYDHFTLVKSKGGWRIVNLVFYVTKRS